MVEEKTCGNCGRQIPPDAPGGICPFCLLKQGIDDPGGPTVDPGPPKAYEDLLVGLMAVQLAMATPEELVEAMAIWSVKRSQPLADHLEAHGIVTLSQRQMLDGLVQESLRQTEGDASKSLEIFGGEEQISRILHASSRPKDAAVVATRIGIPLDAEVIDASDVRALTEEPGRYTRTSEYSRGGMGRILLVHDEYLMREIALKELLPKSPKATDESAKEGGEEMTPVRRTAEVVARFLREAQVTGQLEHPSIVPVYELGKRQNGTLYYTMKLVRGQSLSLAIENADTLSDRLAFLPQFTDVCQAIAYAHSRNVIHRDLKPANIMLGEFGEAVVIDWGLAKVLDKDDPMEEALRRSIHVHLDEPLEGEVDTRAGARLGTAFYMSPEQARGDIHALDRRTDVYSLGVILYELLTGRVPIKGESSRELFDNIANASPTPIGDLEPDAPPELVSICMQALSKDADERYPSARELTDDLMRFETGAYVRAYSYNVREVLARYYRDRRAVINTAAAAAIALLALAVYSYINIAIARDQAIIARDRSEYEKYISEIRLAQSYVKDRNYIAANETLRNTQESYRNLEWGFLLNLCNLDRLTLVGHTGPVTRAAYLSGGQSILTASEDGTAKLWAASNGDLLRTYEGHEDAILDLAVSPLSDTFSTASRDGTVRIWSTQQSEALAVLSGHTQTVNRVIFNPMRPLIASASSDKTIKIWDPGTGDLVADLTGHSTPVIYIEFNDAGTRLLSQSLDGDVIIWESDDWNQVDELHSSIVVDTARAVFTPDGNSVITHDSGDIYLSALVGGEPDLVFSNHEAEIQSVRFSSSGQEVLTTSRDGTARIWELDTGNEVFRVTHDEGIRGADFSPDETQILTVSGYGTLKIWQIGSDVALATLFGHTAEIFAMREARFSPDGQFILTTSHDKTAKIWNAKHPYVPHAIVRHPAATASVSLSSDGKKSVSSGRDGITIISDVESRRPEQLMFVPNPIYVESVFTHDGTRIATTGDGFTPMIFNALSGEAVTAFREHVGLVDNIDIAPDDRTAATGGWDARVRIWDTETGEQIRTLDGHTESITSVRFSQDGRTLITASMDHTSRIWDLESGAERQTLAGHLATVLSADLSPDGTKAVTSSNDNTVIVWEVASGVRILTLNSFSYPVRKATFSADGSRIITGAYDRTIKVWDLNTGYEIISYEMPFLVSDVAISAGEDHLVASTLNGVVQVLPLVPWARFKLPGNSTMPWEDRLVRWKIEQNDALNVLDDGAGNLISNATSTPESLTKGLQQLLESAQSVNFQTTDPGFIVSSRPGLLLRLGLRADDRILSINDNELLTPQDLEAAINAYLEEPDSRVTMIIRRENKGIDLSVHTFARSMEYDSIELLPELLPDDWDQLPVFDAASEDAQMRRQADSDWRARMGEPASEDSPGIWLYGGLFVSERQFFSHLGLGLGDRILEIDGESLTSFERFYEILLSWRERLLEGEALAPQLTIQRGEFRTILINHQEE